MNHRVAVVSVLLLTVISCQRAGSASPKETASAGHSPVQAIVAAPNNHIYAGTFGGGIYRSVDEGATWVDRNIDLGDRDVFAVDVDARGTIFVGTFGGGIYRSDNDAISWKHVSAGLHSEEFVSLKICPTGTLYAGTSNGGVYSTSDEGNTWVSLGLSGKYINTIATGSHGEIFVGCSDGIYASRNGGKTWSQSISGIRCKDVWAVAVHLNGELFAATNGGGVYRSVDNGETWVPVNTGLGCMNAGSLAICSKGNIFVGTTAGVFESKDNGASWSKFDGELSNGTVQCLTVGRSGQVLTGMLRGGVLRSLSVQPLPEQISDFYEEY